MSDVTALETLNLETFLDEHTDIDDAYLARGLHVDKIQTKIGEVITQVNLNTTDIDTVEGYDPATISPIQSALVTILPAHIVGTAEGDIGHTAGAPLVAAPGAGYTLEFISAVVIYDYATGAYAGGSADLLIRQGTTAVTAAIADADLIDSVADTITFVGALSAADIALTENSTLNLFSTEITAGMGAGDIRVQISYRTHTTGLA